MERHVVEVSFLTCTCGEMAAYVNTFYPGGGIDHIDGFLCPNAHLCQVVYPAIEREQRRLKPEMPPDFPGSW